MQDALETDPCDWDSDDDLLPDNYEAAHTGSSPPLDPLDPDDGGTDFDDDLNPNLHEYLVMTIKDAPEIMSGIVDSYEPEGPYGAKEIGEGSTLPVLGAIAHAIKNATGIWFK